MGVFTLKLTNLLRFKNILITLMFCIFLFLFSVKTDILPGRVLSRLYIANANKHDTGNYTCMLSNVIAVTVAVHVLNGKLILFP